MKQIQCILIGCLAAFLVCSCTKEEPITPAINLVQTTWQAHQNITQNNELYTEVTTLSFVSQSSVSMLYERYKGVTLISSVPSTGSYSVDELVITITINNKPAKFVYHVDRLSYTYLVNGETNTTIFNKKVTTQNN